MPTHHHERRRFPRLSNDSSLFLQPLIGALRAIPCLARDISARGLQVQTTQPLPDGERIEIWIKLDDQPGTFLLRGRVRWSRQEDQQYVLGIALDEDQHDLDMESWVALLKPIPEAQVC